MAASSSRCGGLNFGRESGRSKCMQWNEQSLLLMLKDVSVGDGIDAWPSLSGESHASSMLRHQSPEWARAKRGMRERVGFARALF